MNQVSLHRTALGLVLLTVTVALGAEPQKLTDSGRLKFSPAFCQEGRDVVFVELTDPTLYRLQRLNLDSGAIVPLHPDATTSEFEPAWSPDGQCYAYLKTRGALSIGIVVRDKQGALLGEIAPEPGFFGFRSPALAPNQAGIVFSYGESGSQQIYSSRLNGQDRQALTSSQGLNHWPTVSPDGRLIAFGSSRDGNFEIYVMDADGTNQRRLTDQPRQDIRPRFSPDGRRIAFTSHRDGNPEIYIMNADGTNLRRITDHKERDDYPEWHPDGRHVISVSERKGRLDLYLWNTSDSHGRQRE